MQAPSSRDGIRPATMLLFCVIAAQAVAAPPATNTGKVVSVHDGDTVTVRTDNGQTLKVRLQGIDVPELKQPFGSSPRDEAAAAHCPVGPHPFAG